MKFCSVQPSMRRWRWIPICFIALLAACSHTSSDISDRSPVIWKLVNQPSEESTELAVVLEERACSGGRELNADNIEIDIDYRDDSIAILVTADPLEHGFYTCPLNPSSFTIELEESVGDRMLVDRAVDPPTPRDV